MDNTIIDSDSLKASMHFERLPIERLIFPSGLYERRVPNTIDATQALLPILVCRENDSFVVIDGCKRVAYIRENGGVDCFGGVIDSELDSPKYGLLRMQLNRGRDWHLLEKMSFLNWLRNHFGKKEYLSYCAAFGIGSRERYQFETLVQCDPKVVDIIISGELDIEVVPELSSLSHPDQDAIASFFALFKFSRQMQRECIELLTEIRFREKISIPSLLSSTMIREIIDASGITPPQKIQKLRTVLYEWRYPLCSKAQSSWKSIANKSNPDPRRIAFTPSPGFEKKRLTVTILIDEESETRKLFQALADIPPKVWKSLIDPINDNKQF